MTYDQMLVDLPTLTVPEAAFRPYVTHSGLVHVSGQLPVKDGRPLFVGRVPDQVSLDEAREAARLCMRNVLAWLKHACGGDFDRVERSIRISGYVAAGAGFVDAPAVVNAASQMLTGAFGTRGEHARVALGVASLPLDAPVEIEAVFALREA